MSKRDEEGGRGIESGEARGRGRENEGEGGREKERGRENEKDRVRGRGRGEEGERWRDGEGTVQATEVSREMEGGRRGVFGETESRRRGGG